MKKPLIVMVAILAVTAAGLASANRDSASGAVNDDAERRDSANYREMRADTMRPNDGAEVEPIDVEDFVDTATAKGMAELETAKLALEKGTSHVRDFARRMIEDHTKANEKLTSLASQEGVEVADDATLMDQAKAMILKVQDGESFDEAYIDNQIVAHEQTIELFERGAAMEDTKIARFAESTLPKLREHLEMAKALQNKNP